MIPELKQKNIRTTASHKVKTFFRTVRKDTYEGNSTRASVSVWAALLLKAKGFDHFGLQGVGTRSSLQTLVAISRQKMAVSRISVERHQPRKHVSYMNHKHQKSNGKFRLHRIHHVSYHRTMTLNFCLLHVTKEIDHAKFSPISGSHKNSCPPGQGVARMSDTCLYVCICIYRWVSDFGLQTGI